MDILFLTPDRTDATSFYRAGGIAANLEKQSKHNITVFNYDEIQLHWQTILGFDVIMLQRPFTKANYDLCRYIKGIGKKLWVDQDDNLLALNPENRHFMLYSDNVENVKKIIAIADVVSVTTEYLRQSYLSLNKNIWVIPNALNDVFKRVEKKRADIAVWRGSEHHIYDLMAHGKAINLLAEDFPEWKFMFLGFYPWFLAKSENKGFVKPIDIMLYTQSLANLAPAVVHVPLHDNLFNRCKSNIAWIEATFAGAVTVAPEWWNAPGTLSYSNIQEYYEAIAAVLTKQVNTELMVKDSWDFIQEYLTLPKVNKKRIELIESL